MKTKWTNGFKEAADRLVGKNMTKAWLWISIGAVALYKAASSAFTAGQASGVKIMSDNSFPDTESEKLDKTCYEKDDE